MLRKKKHKGAFHALSIGEMQGKEVCYRRRYEKKEKKRKKKGGETQGTTRKNNQPTPPRPAHALSLRGKKTWWAK